MVDVLGLGLGLTLVLIMVGLHYSRDTEWRAPDDISQEVLERRASTVPETDFPEPMNRSIGGGGGTVAVGGGAEGELEGESDGDEGDGTGFDPAAISDDEVEYYEIEYVNEGETIEVANNENLLEAGEDEGWDLPYACREGQCLSCGGKIQEGDAHDYARHSNNEMLGEEEVGKGYILTCVAYPTADFTLETNETP